ncbi:hypothetical protein CDAR_230491 [Caerostris darwini]|uniref:Uncharacterized protein n=1 Tax=Caerostris darwini TaxID=1538125 RepID=A0AAV4RVN7_9ARAC|nr:hypothetical protein CDAR_230491 [Caerostris darwini]
MTRSQMFEYAINTQSIFDHPLQTKASWKKSLKSKSFGSSFPSPAPKILNAFELFFCCCYFMSSKRPFDKRFTDFTQRRIATYRFEMEYWIHVKTTLEKKTKTAVNNKAAHIEYWYDN